MRIYKNAYSRNFIINKKITYKLQITTYKLQITNGEC